MKMCSPLLYTVHHIFTIFCQINEKIKGTICINNWNYRLLLSLCLTGNVFTASSCLKIKNKKIGMWQYLQISWYRGEKCVSISSQTHDCFKQKMYVLCFLVALKQSGGKNDGNYSNHHPLRSTHSYRSSSRTKEVNATSGKGEPRDKVCKI